MKKRAHTSFVIIAISLGGALVGFLLQVFCRIDALMLVLKAAGAIATLAATFFWQLVRELRDVRAAAHLDPMRTRMLRGRVDYVRRKSWSKLAFVLLCGFTMAVCGFSTGVIRPSVAIPIGFSAMATTIWIAASLLVAYRRVASRVEQLSQQKADKERRLGTLG